ncbi:unnamed protein product [Acanthoscelides obtectus]|uniref:Uncharacterized protein n=1 Tax=Acanthoscelides obtectus TaxID=200917 RepID=A0A9P0LZR1_ACAOB|nr:unnamed protein product [Acanthoscelides obtectus]CAK1670877.1 hypothetical protein AOBTE_LOCUS27890 [Acanthoscelides obtectus]
MQDPELHHKAHSTEEAQGLSLEELPRRCPSFLSSLGEAFCPGSSSPPSLSVELRTGFTRFVFPRTGMVYMVTFNTVFMYMEMNCLWMLMFTLKGKRCGNLSCEGTGVQQEQQPDKCHSFDGEQGEEA